MKYFFCFFILFNADRVLGQSYNDYVNAAYSAEQQQNYSIALVNYIRAYDLAPDNILINQKVGLMYLMLGKYDSAVTYYNNAININTSDTVSYAQRGNCYLNLGNSQQALDDFLKCSKLLKKPNSYLIFDIGKCYENLGEFDDAIDHFNHVLTFRPYDKSSLYELGYCYTLKFDKYNAMKYYNQAIAQDPNYYDAYLNRGLLFESQFKNAARAHLDFEKSIDIKPNNRLSYLYEGELFNDENKFKQAKDIFDKVLSMYPDFAEAYCYRGVALYGLGQAAAACDDLNESLKLGCKKAEDYKKKFCP